MATDDQNKQSCHSGSALGMSQIKCFQCIIGRCTERTRFPLVLICRPSNHRTYSHTITQIIPTYLTSNSQYTSEGKVKGKLDLSCKIGSSLFRPGPSKTAQNLSPAELRKLKQKLPGMSLQDQRHPLTRGMTRRTARRMRMRMSSADIVSFVNVAVFRLLGRVFVCVC